MLLIYGRNNLQPFNMNFFRTLSVLHLRLKFDLFLIFEPYLSYISIFLSFINRHNPFFFLSQFSHFTTDGI
jgi:hypothetical protein